MLMFQESIAKEFLDKLVKWAKNIKISDPLEEGCRLGAVVSSAQVINSLQHLFINNLSNFFYKFILEKNN